jgi:hypothetical protein
VKVGIPEGLKGGAPAALALARAPLRDITSLIDTVTTELRSISAATRSMEESTRAIADLHERLLGIEKHVISMDEEVTRMRHGVDDLGRLAGRLKRRESRRGDRDVVDPEQEAS